MATMKRKAVNFDEMVANKEVKLTADEEFEQDDLDFGVVNLNQPEYDFEVRLKYDVLFNDFIILLTKEKDDPTSRRQIGLSETECRKLVERLPTALAYARRYANSKKVGKLIDIPYELDEFEDEIQSVAVLFIKENAYVRGDVQIDIRKCTKNQNNSYNYTRDGVRISSNVAKDLLTHLKSFLETIERNVNITREVMEKAYAFLLVKRINDIHSSKDCQGCTDEQPGKEAHIGVGGCISCWEDIVSDFWTEAWDAVSPSHVLSLAEEVIKLIPNAPGLVTSVIRSESRDEDAVKQIILDREALFQNETYENCRKALSKY